MPKEIIVPAQKSDLKTILDLQKETYLSEARIYGDFSIPPLKQTLDEIEDEFNHQHFLKAVCHETIVGSVRAFEKNDVCYISKLIVDPAKQNRGLGSRLLATIESRFPLAASFELFTGSRSKKNLHLYKKHGYEMSREKKITESITIVFLRKSNAKK